MLNFLAEFKVIIDFNLREFFRFSRKNYFEKPEDKKDLLTPNQLQHLNLLASKYEVQSIENNTTNLNYLENLYILDLLENYLHIENKEELKILDIGSKNWFYAKGEYLFFKKYCKTPLLTGIELDVNRLYNNFYSRFEVAKFHTKNLPNINYIEGNLLNIVEKYDYITWFLPFVTSFAHQKWGLPFYRFKPEKMLLHAYSLLKNKGKMIIINQGADEFEIQKELCEKTGISCLPLMKNQFKSPFFKYKNERFVSIIQKISD